MLASNDDSRVVAHRSDWILLAASWLSCLLLAFSANPHGEDLIAEQMVGRELVDGISPYATLAEFHDVYGGPVDWEWIHPRTPAALALVMPLAPIPTAALVRAMTVVNVTAMLAVVVLSAGMAGRSLKAAALVFPLLMTSEPGGQMIQHASLSSLIGLEVVWTWWSMRQGDSRIGGLPLGVAAAALAGAEQFLAHSNSFSIPGVVVRYGVRSRSGWCFRLLFPSCWPLWVLARRPPWERGMLLGAADHAPR